MSELKDNDLWEIANKYFLREDYSLAQHQIAPFNLFLNNHIDTLVKSYNPVTVLIDNNHEDDSESGIPIKQYKLVINFGDTTMTKPKHTENNGKSMPLLPEASRIRSINYHTSIHMDVNLKIISLDSNEMKISSQEIFTPKIKYGTYSNDA